MENIKNIQKKPQHLPERLTISFPIWGLFDTDGAGDYADLDKMMREHVERGFNCIRLDDGAGLMHDLSGKPIPSVKLRGAWGPLNNFVRQSHPFNPGPCDTRKRLLDMFAAAKKYNIFIILSSWYFLHTYWYVDDPVLNDSIYAIEPHERYAAFAKYLHYILCELEEKNLDSQIAFVEIFNEADGLSFCGGYGNQLNCPEEERLHYRNEHIQAIDYLRDKHPKIMFAYDVSNPRVDNCLAPDNVDVFNFHNYFMWSAYNEFHEEPDRWLRKERISREDVIHSSNYPEKLPADWIDRVWFYGNLDTQKIPEAEQFLTENFLRNIEKHRDKLQRNMDLIRAHSENLFPDSLIVCGEGVSYIGSDELLFEEKCAEYWELLKEAALIYRAHGLWGAVVRTCCGPEDPVWNMCPEKLLEINDTFRYGK